MKQLEDQVAIVTGASKGIGKAIAYALCGAGAKVALAARSKRDLKTAEEELRVQKFEVMAVPTDITDAGAVKSLVETTVKKFGKVDILVNNAGIGTFAKVEEMAIEEFDAMWNVNVRGVILATKAVLPTMISARSGKIVNIASLAGKNWLKGGAGYAATKWALRGFSGSLMLEVRDRNIKVMTVFPGSVNTEFSSTTSGRPHIPQPEDVASAVVFALTSPQRALFSEIDLRPTTP
ncbi:MAG TPA: SDR family NAD(P)-dependent oxidoreductase [Bacteroidota bacterium]